MTSEPVAVAAGAALAGYLVLFLPLATVTTGSDLARTAAADRGALAHFYRRSIAHLFLLAGVALGVAGLAGWSPGALGVTVPYRPLGTGLAPWAAILLGAAGVVAVRSALRPSPASGTAALLPRSAVERRLFAALAVTTGFTEELLFRGFLMAFLVHVAGATWPQAAAGSAAAFGLNHAYQGARGAAISAAAGYLLAETYLLTGSLLAPVIAHLAVDLLQMRRAASSQGQKCSPCSRFSSRSPSWNTYGEPGSTTPSPATNSNVGAVADA